MKLASTLSIGLALALGVAGMTAPTAVAAKTEKPPAAPAFKLSPPFRAAIGPVQALIKSGDTTGANAKLVAAEALATAPDEKYVAGAVRLELAGALKNQQMQAQALEAMVMSGSTPAADMPKFNFYLGNFAYQAQNYAKALGYFTAADKGGYNGGNQTDMLLLLAESNFKLNQPTAGFPFIDRAIALQIAAGQKPPESWYSRASSVAYKAKLGSEVAKWTGAQVRAYPTAENWRSALVTYRDGTKLEGNQSLDLMRLMRLTKSLAGERDFFEYASMAVDRALPGEAKSAIEEGFASGAVTKSSRPVGELLTVATNKIPGDRASLVASEKAAAGGAAKIAKGTADGYLGYGEDAKAISLYRLALQKGGVDADEVNTRLGIALARSGQKPDARKAFALVKGTVRADIARYWLLWLDLNP